MLGIAIIVAIISLLFLVLISTTSDCMNDNQEEQMAIDKNIKELATVILKTQGIDHDTWLTEKYQEVISENTKVLTEALNFKMENDKNR